MQQQSPPERLVIDVPEIHVTIPAAKAGEESLTEEELKELVWKTHKDEILKKMTLHSAAEKSELEQARRRLVLLDQISEVQRQFLQKKEPRAVFGYLLTGLLDMMDAEYGFIGQIKYEDDGTMYLQSHAITNIAWNQATRQFYEDNVEAGLRFYNLDSLFGHVMVHKEPIIANDPYNDSRACGIPEGHPPLNHFLGIPFFEPGGKTMNGMVGIANKQGGFSQADVDFLEPFTVTCSNLIQAYGAMQENIRLIDTLEEKVKERTFELELANARLEKANRRVVEASAAQLKNFACMSHEIRTPLNCIVGLSSLLLETDMTPQQNDSMRMIVTSGELLSAIVNDVLDYSKLISGNVEIDIQPTDLQDTLDAVVHSIEVKAKDRNLKLVTTYDPFVPKIIDTDGRRLQQILYNLLGNAIKFSRDNGRVELSISLHDLEDNNSSSCPEESGRESEMIHVNNNSQSAVVEHQSPCEEAEETGGSGPPVKCPFHRPQQTDLNLQDDSTISSTSSHGSSSRCPFGKSSSKQQQGTHQNSHAPSRETKRVLRFVVKDYGKGIEKADFAKIFKPFMQASGETEKLYGGTGLGLAITSKLVEGLGGSIAVDSQIHEYAEFTVDIPFHRPKADVESLSRLLSDTRILVVNEDKAQGLSPFLLEKYKLNIVEFVTCAELSLLARVKGAIDNSRTYLCLIHEDLYDQQDLAIFLQAAPGTSVLTFGPRYSVKDAFTKGHYRSLVHLVPSSFVHSLIQAKSMETMTKTIAVDAAPDVPTYSYDKLKVLVAEDNIINQKVVTNMLKRVGILNVKVVDNGKKAVDAAANEYWDLILMDMQMPVMDGVEATRLIVQQENPGKIPPKIVFVTANASESFETEAREAGATGYISKPFNLKKIETFMASFMTGRDFITAA